MTANRLFMLLVFGFSGGYTFLSLGLPFGTFSMPGPGMVPVFSGVMATLLSGYLLLTEYMSAKRAGAMPPQPQTATIDDQEESSGTIDYPMRILWFVISFAVYILIFKPLGYVLSTMLFTTVLFKIMENKWVTSIFAGVVVAMAFYLVFSLLAVPLPQGVLSGLKIF